MKQSAGPRAAFLNTRKFASLDGLRCFSILAVIWHHATGIGKGYLGVEIFFAISGFLITTLLLRERRAFDDISLDQFYARRSLRIFPLYYTILAVYVVLVATQRNIPAGKDFFHNLKFFATYTSNWFVPLDGRVIFYLSWSLATEEQFYLVVPWIEKFLRGFAVPVIALILVVHLASAWVPLGIVIAKISTPLCLGVLAAHGLENEKSFRYIAVVTYPKWASAFWSLAVITLAWISAGEILLSTAMTALVVSSAIRPDHGMAWLFDWEPLQSVGRISYGMYLMHQLCLNVVKRVVPALPPVTLFALGSSITYLVALASYRWYESIFLRIKERYVRRAPATVSLAR